MLRCRASLMRPRHRERREVNAFRTKIASWALTLMFLSEQLVTYIDSLMPFSVIDVTHVARTKTRVLVHS
jgi:hypothetical protein